MTRSDGRATGRLGFGTSPREVAASASELTTAPSVVAAVRRRASIMSLQLATRLHPSDPIEVYPHELRRSQCRGVQLQDLGHHTRKPISCSIAVLVSLLSLATRAPSAWG